MPRWIDYSMLAADLWMQYYPRCKPKNINTQTRIIAHRGERDGLEVKENTFAALDPLVTYNQTQPGVPVWGIECDVRWTKDLEPVILHDPDLVRVFGQQETLNQLSFKQLRQLQPSIPHLAELVERYRGQLHFMLEIKSEPYPNLDLQNQRLAAALEGLQPQQHFHLYSFDAELLDKLSITPPQAKILIAVFNRSTALQHVIHEDYAGLGAHYTVMNQTSIHKLQATNKKACIGMVDSRNALCRELRRGGDWLFSNHAIKIAQYLSAWTENHN